MEVPGFSSQCSGGQCGVWPWAEQVSVFTKNMMERGEEDWRSPNRRQGEVGAADTAQSLELQIELPRHTVNNYHGLASLSCLTPYRSCRGSHSPAGARLMTKLNFSRSFPCPCRMIMMYCWWPRCSWCPPPLSIPRASIACQQRCTGRYKYLQLHHFITTQT